MRRKMVFLSLLVVVVAFGSLSFTDEPTQDEPKFKNLKVLPKNISRDELTIVMKQYKTALGVKCNFCHAQSTTDPSKLDFASDENKHKEIARSMMKMTKRINKKYFRDDPKGAITCYTCHNGQEEPKAPPIETLDD